MKPPLHPTTQEFHRVDVARTYQEALAAFIGTVDTVAARKNLRLAPGERAGVALAMIGALKEQEIVGVSHRQADFLLAGATTAGRILDLVVIQRAAGLITRRNGYPHPDAVSLNAVAQHVTEMVVADDCT